MQSASRHIGSSTKPCAASCTKQRQEQRMVWLAWCAVDVEFDGTGAGARGSDVCCDMLQHP
jgi:hypothetical protein